MVLSWLKKSLEARAGTADARGLVIFTTVEEAMKAEKVLKKAGFDCKLVAPPPDMRKGCDLALEIDLVEQTAVARALTGRVSFMGIYPCKGEMEPLQVEKVTRFAEHVMIKSGNMKLVFDIKTGVIVNISGGGCPDIPYLYTRLVGTHLAAAPRPKDEGRTLCALMLDRALEKALEIWKGVALN
ncbi:hypothetical protein MTAT_08110 [Moorella thermoacetica]|uniref:Se/S carrier protein-like domain-containing protein n=1 Tax=Neomoorella thermoacetica TaxID=1525 RepID=A0AAC9HIC2_NEOTH|nr:DUF3343 domain-containing protein [Moorella thermoacetica]AOQ24170.1 hypothetical protein Maut_01733 [Moorella thermoacetica]OIQ61415.1 hypothetical protein MTIN_14910 [Moorella thermoacetica]TYL14576.1 hypothetical protein MTAT_08110 [Moorella thermoacetica]